MGNLAELKEMQIKPDLYFPRKTIRDFRPSVFKSDQAASANQFSPGGSLQISKIFMKFVLVVSNFII